jgi:hypothetical protein
VLKATRTKVLFTLAVFLIILISDFMGANSITSAMTSQETTKTLQITSVDGKNVTLAIRGNVSVNQITDFFFQNLPDWYNHTNIDFNLIELNGSSAFVNMTIPKDAILGGTAPVVATNGGLPKNDGFTQDTENFYVWFTTTPLWDNAKQSSVTIQFLLATSHNKLLNTCTQTFTILAHGTQTATVTLNKGETLSGDIYLSDRQGKDINFQVTDPNGDSIVQYDYVTSKSWNFVATKNGTYILSVYNSSPVLASKDVTLTYYVKVNGYSSGGLDLLRNLTFFALIIIVVVGLIVVRIRRLKTKSNPQQGVTSLPRPSSPPMA